MNERVIVVHWLGPFDYEDLGDESKVLYLATGRTKYQRSDQIQYCGITQQSLAYRKKRHPKLGQITKHLKVWVGKIAHPSRSKRADLEAAESMIVYFWQPPLNKRKKTNPPQRCILISHWFYPKGQPRQRKKKILRDLSDVMCWDGEFWRTANLHRWSNC